MLNSVELNQIGKSPKITFVLVHNKDIDNVSYCNGCQSYPKTMTEKDSNGSTMKTTTFKYQDSNYPTVITDIEVS